MGKRRRGQGVAVSVLAGLVTAVLVGAFASAASAAPLAPAWKLCVKGTSAGRCSNPRGVAVSPVSGHVFVANQYNNRIDEFTAWGDFVKAWGWGVRNGAEELQVCTAAPPGCQEGIKGSGPGQLRTALGVAVDSEGDVYVVDRPNFRVEKFSPAGEFLLMFGAGVDQGPNHPGNVCTAAYIAEGDTCGAGTAGTANGQFASSWSVSSVLAVGPDDEVFVGDEERIQVFDAAGVYQRQLPLPHPGVVGELAVDPASGDVYMGYLNRTLESERTLPNIYRLDPSTGVVLDTLEVEKPAAVATDATGEVFVFEQQVTVNGSPDEPGSYFPRILRFDASGNLVEVVGEPGEIRQSVGIAASSVCFGAGDVGLYASAEAWAGLSGDYVQAYGPTPDPDKCAPPPAPPALDAQFASSVDSDSAMLKARINPHYFTGAVGTTTYYVEWATTACIEAGGWESACVSEQPAAPGATLDAEPVNSDVTTAGILVSGLAPDTTYRYRFVAEGSGEPGAVVGVGGEPGVEGADAAFATLPAPSSLGACPNDAFRLGAGANLRDCRAYELVSPLDKVGGDVQARLNVVPFEARMDEAAISGEAITYSAYRPFGEAESAPFSSQYLARRGADGWGTAAISPPQEGEAFVSQLLPIDNAYRAFMPDLSMGWLQIDNEPVLGQGGVAGYPNIYRRQSTSGVYESCTSAAPLDSEPGPHGPQLQGFSANGQMAVFRIENRLTANASTKKWGGGSPIYQLYACSFEGGLAQLHLVSALPDKTASELQNTVGGPANEQFQGDQGRTESLENAVAADGSRVFWTASNSNDAKEPGALYVRLNPAAASTPTGACSAAEPQKACTTLISAGPARFWLASEVGSRAIFSTAAGDLEEYEVAGAQTRLLAHQVLGVLGASEDARSVYYLSEEATPAAEADGAEPGEPNLYLRDAGGTVAFVGILSDEDATQESGRPGPATAQPVWHTARVTPDGQTLAFTSNSSRLAREVAGYDNIDQTSNQPAIEIYRYSVGTGLACISCNRTGARPSGREVQEKTISRNSPLYAAAILPPWLNSLYAPRVLSENGQRVFFESFEPLVLSDTNGRADVYQWESRGTGTCTEADSGYAPASAGCLSLVSSGRDSYDSQFVDASPDGRDVFIRTSASLVSWDPGQIDIYDAREGGGLPAPASPGPECEGEGCQPVVATPDFPTPASTIEGPGNVKESRPKRCPKGTHRKKQRGKTRCVKNKKHTKHRQSGRNR